MNKHFSIALLITSLSLIGCQATCNDYRGSLLGPPAGCECLETLYGCGPLDEPDGGIFTARLASRRAAHVRAKSVKTSAGYWRINLRKGTGSCRSMRNSIAGTVRVRTSGRSASISLGDNQTLIGTQTATGLNASGALNVSRSCRALMTTDFVLSKSARSANVAALIRLQCTGASAGSSCSQRYAGTANKLN